MKIPFKALTPGHWQLPALLWPSLTTLSVESTHQPHSPAHVFFRACVSVWNCFLVFFVSPQGKFSVSGNLACHSLGISGLEQTLSMCLLGRSWDMGYSWCSPCVKDSGCHSTPPPLGGAPSFSSPLFSLSSSTHPTPQLPQSGPCL